MRNRRWKRLAAVLACTALAAGLLAGCVDQYPERKEAGGDDSEYLVEGSTAKKKAGENPRIVATSAATCEIMERLDLDLAGRPTELTTPLPDRYMDDSDCVDVGGPMAPDIEIISSLDPDYVLGPATLQPAFESQFQEAGLPYLFLNLKSVQGMYKSIEQLGEIFDRQDEAQALVDEFEEIYTEYYEEHGDREGPSVLILMGVPGAYMVATPKSYVGNLVELAGGQNIYGDETEEFIMANTEDMQKRDPDIILRCSHALPDVVREMFAEEFETNDIWKHFRAVQEGRVYDLTYANFGMSATFNWPNALEELEPYLYGE